MATLWSFPFVKRPRTEYWVGLIISFRASSVYNAKALYRDALGDHQPVEGAE